MDNTTKLRVWWIPQIPMEGEKFLVDVKTIEEGIKLVDVLAKYDLYQYDNNIKPDYANAGGIQYFDEEESSWCSLDDEDEDEGVGANIFEDWSTAVLKKAALEREKNGEPPAVIRLPRYTIFDDIP